ncbi:TadE family type IV pilus minor pilin [Glutamicibacter arilaitensis]|uniref:TadE family type IV pilus minor pilin n=1 Tax=Glutamicibacter arilaitensis TaxID=256701 RepID=UPI00384FC55D
MNLNDERGSSTAEFAVLLPAVAVFLSLLLCFGILGMKQIQVQQAAAAMARELARGEESSVVHSSGIRLAGHDATYSISKGGGFSEVHVSKSMRIPLLGPIKVKGAASVALE